MADAVDTSSEAICKHVDANLNAVAGSGPKAPDWDDKPHRLIYDDNNLIKALAAERDELERLAVAMAEGIRFGLDCNVWTNAIEARAAFTDKEKPNEERPDQKCGEDESHV